jgi:hypothetical protein
VPRKIWKSRSIQHVRCSRRRRGRERVPLRHRIPFARLSESLVQLLLARGVERVDEPADDEESWMLIHRAGDITWSKAHARALDELRSSKMARANRENAELSRFMGARSCRLAQFAPVYAMGRVDACGHCDVCDPGLALQEKELG